MGDQLWPTKLLKDKIMYKYQMIPITIPPNPMMKELTFLQTYIGILIIPEMEDDIFSNPEWKTEDYQPVHVNQFKNIMGIHTQQMAIQ